MAQYRLDRGLVIQSGSHQYAFQRAVENSIQFEEIETGRIKVFERDQLVADILQGFVHVLTSSLGQPRVHPNRNYSNSIEDEQAVRVLGKLTDKQRGRFERRCRYVKAMRKLGVYSGNRRLVRNHLPSVAAKFNDIDPPSVSAVMLWLKKCELSGGNYLVLVDKQEDARKQLSLSEHHLEKIANLLRKHYLVRQGCSVAYAYELLTGEPDMYLPDKGCADNRRLAISRSAFYRLVNRIPAYERDRARMNPAAARAKWRHAVGGVYVERPLERVEMDHTVLDLYVIDDKRGVPLGRPVITILVDAYTQYILALYIGFEGESLSRVIRAIRLALSPKGAMTTFAKTRNDWLTPGLMECLVVDNALAFQSSQLHDIANAVGFELEYGAVRQPWFKGSVERAVGSVTMMLPRQGRPEKTKGGIATPKDSAREACIMFSDLNEALIKWAVDVHPFKINVRKMSRPIDLMTEGLKNMPAPVFVTSLDNLEFITSLSKEVTVSHTGIEFYYLNYRSIELRDLAHQQPTPSFKTTIKYDPNDLGKVWVLNPLNREWIVVPCLQQTYANGLTLYQHKLIRKQAKNRLKPNSHLYSTVHGRK